MPNETTDAIVHQIRQANEIVSLLEKHKGTELAKAQTLALAAGQLLRAAEIDADTKADMLSDLVDRIYLTATADTSEVSKRMVN